jgi:hypothetical protein
MVAFLWLFLSKNCLIYFLLPWTVRIQNEVLYSVFPSVLMLISQLSVLSMLCSGIKKLEGTVCINLHSGKKIIYNKYLPLVFLVIHRLRLDELLSSTIEDCIIPLLIFKKLKRHKAGSFPNCSMWLWHFGAWGKIVPEAVTLKVEYKFSGIPGTLPPSVSW